MLQKRRVCPQCATPLCLYTIIPVDLRNSSTSSADSLFAHEEVLIMWMDLLVLKLLLVEVLMVEGLVGLRWVSDDRATFVVSLLDFVVLTVARLVMLLRVGERC